MHPNFLVLLFLLAFANYAEADGKLGEVFRKYWPRGDQHLATAKDKANAINLANVKNEAADAIPKLTEIYSEQAPKIDDKNNNKLKEFKKFVKGLGYSAKDVGVDTRKFQKWLDQNRPERVESLIKVFEYLVGLDSVPICVANQFLKSIDPNDLIIGQIGQMVKQRKAPVVGDHQTDRMAFIFSQTSVRQLNIDEEGIKCKESLKEPAFVAKLFYEIVVGLEKEEKAGASERKVSGANNKRANTASSRKATLAKSNNKRANTNNTNTARSRTTLAQAFKEQDEWESKIEKLACSVKIQYVFNHLKNVFIAGKHQFDAVVKIVRKKISKWETIGNKLERIGHQFKEYSLMLLTPANFQYFLSVVLAIAQLSGVVILAADSVRAFGLDELLTKEIQDISSKRKECEGVTCDIALWLFGVNGAIPLYLRGYEVKENNYGQNRNEEVKKAEMHYYDHNGKKYISIEEANKLQHSKEEDEKFIKIIVTELIQHKGRPCDNFMLKTVEKLKSLGDKKKWEERAGKFKQGWTKFQNKLAAFKQEVKEIDPAKVLTSLENAVKDITFFLITPRHIASALRLILSLFGLYLPVYISLEVLQFLGITDIIIEIMKVSTEAVVQVNKFRKGGKAEAAMDFMFNENGVVPMLLTMGTPQDTKQRRLRVAKELEMFGLIKNAIIKHNGDSLKELYQFFVDQIKQNSVGLTIVQTFQKEQAFDRAKQLWAVARTAIMPPWFNTQWNLVFMQEQAIKEICDLREMSERVEEFDKKISFEKKTKLEDVYELKMERGDCTVIAAGKSNDGNEH